MRQARTSNPPHGATLSLIRKVPWVGANQTSPPLSFWPGPASKVVSGQLSSPVELSLSGSYYHPEPLLPPFDQSVRHPEWEIIVFPFSLFTGPQVLAQGLWAFLLLLLLLNSPYLRQAILNKCLAFLMDQLSGQSRVYLGHSQLWPISSPISRWRPAPQFLVLSQPASSVPAGVRCCLCVSYCVFIPPATISVQVSPGVGLWICRSGRGGNF